MTAAQELIASIRREVAGLSAAVRGHRYIAALREGRPPRQSLRTFAGEQYHIIKNDMRSFALLLSRQEDFATRQFLAGSVAYEGTAFAALLEFADALGLSDEDLEAYEPMAGAHAYTAFLALTALYGSAAEMAAAFVVDLEGWGGNCRAMGETLRERYGFRPAQLRFFDHFGTEDPTFEARSLAVVEADLARGLEPRAVRRTARLMMEYELLFWDTMAQAAGPARPAGRRTGRR
jgi:thiaminase